MEAPLCSTAFYKAQAILESYTYELKTRGRFLKLSLYVKFLRTSRKEKLR